MPSPLPFILDCDTGRDDALTIWLADSLNLPLKTIIASYGNTRIDHVYDNCQRTLALTNTLQPCPVLWGAEKPSHFPHKGFTEIVEPRQNEAGNGLCNVQLPTQTSGNSSQQPAHKNTPDDLAAAIKALYAQHGKLDYFITGPATNFANICAALGRETHDYINHVYMMGGKMAIWDNMPGADFNLICDPYAIDTIQDTGFEIHFITMDTTWPIYLPLADIKSLSTPDNIAHYAKELMIAYCKDFAPDLNNPEFRFHDPCVILAAMHPEHFTPHSLSIERDENHPHFGRLTLSPDGKHAYIYECDTKTHAQFLDMILRELKLKLKK